jgi:spore germination protein GerM
MRKCATLPKKEVLNMIKFVYKLLLLLLVVLFLTSCNLTELLKTSDFYTNPTNEPRDQPSNISDVPSNRGGVGLENIDKMQTGIELVVIGERSEEILEDAIPASAVVNPNATSQPDAHWPIKLFFANRTLIVEGKPGSYGFVTPVIREVPVTSGILKYTLYELIKGPQPSEENLGSVLPPSTKINKVSIEEGVAVIDFNEALLTDHPGGTLGGVITIQALVFTASQFDSIDGVLVTVGGEPWDDGHFIWDTPVYERDLLN